MYYSSGNYEAFAHPKKPSGVERKSAYLVGTGLSALSAACYLVRDGQMKGERVHLFEQKPLPGGASDGYQYPGIGYVMRGIRALDEHSEVMWDLLHSIPSLEDEDVSVLEECCRLNRAEAGGSFCLVTADRSQDVHNRRMAALSEKGCRELVRLFFTPDEQLSDRKISDVLDAEVLRSEFWFCWSAQFAFEPWHSALELKRSLKRNLHQAGMLRGICFTKYNPYESLVLPMVRYLENHGVRFHYNTRVTNIEFEQNNGRKQAKTICLLADGQEERVDLTENDLVFIAGGGSMENTSIGSQDQPPDYNPALRSGSWTLWQRIAAQDAAFGRPECFCASPDQTREVSATIAARDERILSYIQNAISPNSVGRVVTVRDSGWQICWAFRKQPLFRNQPKGQWIGWLCGRSGDRPGDYIDKPMQECTGKEICMEWLYHLGVPENRIEDLAEHGANTVPMMMPYATAALMPRRKGDRPEVVPEGAVNFAFLGQFAETPRETAGTIEYSMRTGMEAVYTLLGVDRGVPEVWGSTYDIRDLLFAAAQLRDGRPLSDLGFELPGKIANLLSYGGNNNEYRI